MFLQSGQLRHLLHLTSGEVFIGSVLSNFSKLSSESSSLVSLWEEFKKFTVCDFVVLSAGVNVPERMRLPVICDFKSDSPFLEFIVLGNR